MTAGRTLYGLGATGAVLMVLVAGSTPAPAQDAPHWSSSSDIIDCSSQCHTTHHALGGNLTAAAGNVNLCQSCHSPGNMAQDLAILSADAAVPGVSGSSHAFDVAAVNAVYGAQLPLNSEMALRIMGGNLVCSTCHDQHRSEIAEGGTPRVAPAQKVVSAGGTGLLASGGTFTGTAGLWYLVEIVATGSETSARFHYSKDNGMTWTPPPAAPCTAGDPSGCLTASAAAVALDNGVTVSFAGGNNAFRQSERWEFSAAYPFLQAPLDSGSNATGDAFCRDCHRAWVMDHTAVQIYDGSPKSHPVGVGLTAVYDRAQPLDGNGQPQNAGAAADVDGNPSNDLTLDSGGLVHCLSCHGVHNADGNTQTVAAR